MFCPAKLSPQPNGEKTALAGQIFVLVSFQDAILTCKKAIKRAGRGQWGEIVRERSGRVIRYTVRVVEGGNLARTRAT